MALDGADLPGGAPWHSAGDRAAGAPSADAVRDVGWVFNNVFDQPLDDFVRSGEIEVTTYGTEFGLLTDHDAERTLAEIGSGIGRMTAAFTRRFGHVIACDIDAAFLDRCRETVAAHGRPAALRTAHVADGSHLPVPDRSCDVVFSYITLQHCRPADALALVGEATRIAVAGGRIALSFRSFVGADAALLPGGRAVRAAWRVTGRAGRRGPLGDLLQHRAVVRLGWQANRLGPRDVLDHLVGHGLVDPVVYVHADAPRWRASLPSWQIGRVPVRRLDWINRSHWWLVSDVG